jgi:hypothetical protein
MKEKSITITGNILQCNLGFFPLKSLEEDLLIKIEDLIEKCKKFSGNDKVKPVTLNVNEEGIKAFFISLNESPSRISIDKKYDGTDESNSLLNLFNEILNYIKISK